MVLKTIKTIDAVGHILCHDITKIVPGEFKGALYKKGHIVKEEDIEILLNIGKDELYVWAETEGLLHENDAAVRLKDIITGSNLSISKISEGKINLIADCDGVLKINLDDLFKLNMIDEIIVATKNNLSFIKKGDIVASTRVIPLLIDENKILEAERITNSLVINLIPLKKKKIAIVTTGNEVFYGRIKDKFQEVLLPKFEKYGSKFIGQTIVPDDIKKIENAITSYLEDGAELIICTGGMSVDPTDITPQAIMNTGSEIVAYGMPLLSGSMTLIAYNKNVPIIGLPAGVLFAEKSSIDVILYRLLSYDLITREEVSLYGNGGLL